MKGALDTFESLDRLVFSYLELPVVKGYLTDLSHCLNIVYDYSVVISLFKESLHNSLHFATLQSTFNPPFRPKITVLFSQEPIREVSQLISSCTSCQMNSKVRLLGWSKWSFEFTKVFEVVVILLLIQLSLLLLLVPL